MLDANEHYTHAAERCFVIILFIITDRHHIAFQPDYKWSDDYAS